MPLFSTNVYEPVVVFLYMIKLSFIPSPQKIASVIFCNKLRNACRQKMKSESSIWSLFLASFTIFIFATASSISLSNVTTIEQQLSPESQNVSQKRIVIIFWCPHQRNESCKAKAINSDAMRWRQLPQPQRNILAAAIGGGVGAGLGGAIGGGIGSLSLVPFGGSIVGATSGALGGGIGGSLGGGEGGAIGGALGGAVGSGIGGLLGAPGAAVGGGTLGALGAGLGTYLISNGTFPDVVGQLNATLVPFSNFAGQTLNATWNTFLTDVLLIGPEENVLTLLGDYEEDLTDTS